MDIRVFIRLHELISTKQTGAPKQLAQKLEISERSAHYYIAFMKNELCAPITYNKNNQSYVYDIECDLCFVSKKIREL